MAPSAPATLDDEASFEPLPEPEQDAPLPLTWLAPPALEDHVEQAALDLAGMQRSIISVVRRTTGLRLVPARPPHRGLSRISFELAKAPGQRVPVTRVGRAAPDLGVETGRAPARITLGERIEIELPLTEEERSFAPIGPLLVETTPRDHGAVTFLVGRRQDGTPYELACHHALVVGSSGFGKTILLRGLVLGVCCRYSPRDVRLALVDFKAYELDRFRGLPHLWQEVVTTAEGFDNLVENLADELHRRKQARVADPGAEFPVLLTIVDEFSGHGERLVRLIAEARALDMFFVLATQHPTSDVISTKIKANLSTAIAFRTKEPSGSRMAIGCADATRLSSRGDCLVASPTGLVRVQASWVTDRDMEALARHLRRPAAGEPTPDQQELEPATDAERAEPKTGGPDGSSPVEPGQSEERAKPMEKERADAA